MLVGSVLAGRLTPAVRWFFRQRAERVVEEVGRRGIRLPAFKLTRRRTVIHRLTHDPELIAAAEEYSRVHGTSMAAAMARVERHARGIVPSFNAFLYFRVGIPLAARVSRALYNVRVVSDEGLIAIDRYQDSGASVIFVMNHRSNMDYVILAYLTASRAALTYAAGEWACVWPLGRLIGAMGAFFVRRGSGDELYRRVLERFVQMAVEGGLTQVVFPEGGLSRDGKLREPKIGLFDYMLRRFDPEVNDLVFVPVAINYDWVLEDYSLVQPGGPEAGLRGWGGLFASTAHSVAHNLFRALRGGLPLGDAAVSFGAPVSMREYADAVNVDFRRLERDTRIEQVKLFARRLMQAIGDESPPASVPLVARVLLDADGKALSPERLIARAWSLTDCKAFDPEAALRALVLRGFVNVERGRCLLAPNSEMILAYYANSSIL